MAILKCKMCGGELAVADNSNICVCDYCGTKQTVPSARDEILSNLFNRANNLRLRSEFDKAQELYEKIVAENPNESEAYWGIVLCKYGIEYVEDPATKTRIPTCHRTQLQSILADGDFKSAITNADVEQKSIYEEEAERIDEIQKDILKIVHNEKPFDVFICYKETDESGKRTVDSSIANDIYYQLTQEGFKVFYAAITLEDKLGQEYEPYIFAALNSAKTMLVLGTKPEYFTAVWVRNEWSRFMKLMQNDRSKLLIPCYRDMDAYDLPEEFAHLQAQDMGKIGFINDVVRGIKKVISNNDTASSRQDDVYAANVAVEPLLKRMNMFFEDEDYASANEYAEKILDLEPENVTAYWGLLLAKFKCSSDENLLERLIAEEQVLDDDKFYQKIIRFAGENNKYAELNLKIKKHFQEVCASLSEQIEQLSSEISAIENELAGMENALQEFNARKNAQQEEQKQEYAQIAGLDDEYERYAGERKTLLKEKESMPFWNKIGRVKIDERLKEINDALQECVRKKSRLKEELNSKYKRINEELDAEERALRAKMEEPNKLCYNKKKELSRLSGEKDRLLKLC